MIYAGRFADRTAVITGGASGLGLEAAKRITADPAFLGLHRQTRDEISFKVIEKHAPDEKLGVVVNVDGTPQVIEYSDLSPELAERREGWAAGRRGAVPIYLEPLGDDVIEQMLDTLVADLPPAVREQIGAQAQGVPLYAIETWPGIAGTTGGPRHDERARVLRPDGRPAGRSGARRRRVTGDDHGRRIDRRRHGELAKGGLRDAMKDRRRHNPAVRRAIAWRVDQHENCEYRLTRRDKPDERHVVIAR